MPCVTWLSKERIQSMRAELQDPDIQELLDELNALEDDKWTVHKFEVPVHRGWFRSPGLAYRYTLYYATGIVDTEYQIINLAPQSGEADLHQDVAKGDILNFLIGCIGGHRAALAKARTT